MRTLNAIAKLGWNLPRFLKQIGCLILGVAGLSVLGIASLLYFFLYFNFSAPKSEWPEEISAVERALSIPDNAKPCYENNLSRDNISCYVPYPEDRRHCRWWIFESCRSFTTKDFILEDPAKLGTMISAMMHPIRRGPIVIEFVGRKKNVIMRID